MLTGTAAGTATTVTGNTATPATTTATVSTANAGEGFAIVIAAGAGGLSGVNTTAGNGTELKYVARDGDTVTDVADNLVKQFNSWITDNGGTADDMVASNVAGVITFTGGTTGSEEASAKLQALQVQQQLGIQSLSIANQAPQSVLSLFR